MKTIRIENQEFQVCQTQAQMLQSKLIRMVEGKYNLPGTFLTKTRERCFSDARRMIMHILINCFDYDLHAVARLMSKDRSTVFYHLKGANNMLEYNQEFKRIYQEVMSDLRAEILKNTKPNESSYTDLPKSYSDDLARELLKQHQIREKFDQEGLLPGWALRAVQRNLKTKRVGV